MTRFSRTIRWLASDADLEQRTRLAQGDAPASRGVLEDHPRLDLRVLAAQGYCRPGEENYGLVSWRGEGSPIGTLQFMISLKDPANAFIELEASSGGSLHYQALRLIDRGSKGRTRWCFVCPVSGAPVEMVAFRGERFASARAQRLANRSQHAPRPGRKVRRKAVRSSPSSAP